jgi:uncharacterized protein with NAD-binding domain and iron-sulfur cluster
MPGHPEHELTPLTVTVVGGGITGLSAAHELMERGFAVQVIEKRADPYRPNECQVGGMARTQWCRFPSEEFVFQPQQRGMRRARPPVGLARAAAEDVPKHRAVGPEADYVAIPFALHSSELEPHARERLVRAARRLRDYVERWVARDEDGRPCEPAATRKEIVYVEGYRYLRRHGAWDAAEPGAVRDESPALSRDRAAAVRRLLADELARSLPPAQWGGFRVHSTEGGERECRYADYVSLRAVDLKDVLGIDGASRPRDQAMVRVRVAEIAFPGEHGYRFFPTFYRHLFDVMRRIPILEVRARDAEGIERERTARAYGELLKQRHGAHEPAEPDVVAAGAEAADTRDWAYVRDGRTAYDNLVAAELHSVAQDNEEDLAVLSRRRPTSLSEVFDFLRTFQERMGFELRDLARYQLKLTQYMTSSARRRREEYETKSWNDFIGIDEFSESFQEAMRVWPQALVGMRADEVDARTAGNVTSQILLDQLRDSGLVDATLNASTSEAWLEPWRRYLESEGVRFRCAELAGIEWNDRTGVSFRFAPESEEVATTDYYVLALPVEAAYDVAKRLRDAMSPWAHERWFAGTDLARLVAFMEAQGWDPLQQEEPEPKGPLRHLSGIQFYLEHDVRLVRGHVYYANSPWGLSSISQAQFRREAPGVRDEYRGLISLDIGNWHAPGRYRVHRRGWDCSPRELADEVWAQVKAAARTGSRALSEPVWYHVDDDITYGFERSHRADAAQPPARGVARNESPYLLNLPGAWALRPGGPEDDLGRYSLLFEGAPGSVKAVVLAGTFMKTHTRLATMEAANESARHAVNRILDHAAGVRPAGRIGPVCDVWPLEERELPDLKALRDLDDKLCRKGLPHLFEILQLDAAFAVWADEPSSADGGAPSAERLLEWCLAAKPFDFDWLRRLGVGSDVIAALEEVLGRRRGDGRTR